MRHLRRIPLRTPTVIMLVAGALAVMFVGTVAILVSRGDRANVAAQIAVERAAAGKRQIAQQQAERARSLRLSCEQTNKRNRNTKRIVRRFPPSPGRSVTFLLIDALAPVQDCDALVRQRVNPSRRVIGHPNP